MPSCPGFGRRHLDLDARTPGETAGVIAAELIQLRWGGIGQPLTATSGRIHRG